MYTQKLTLSDISENRTLLREGDRLFRNELGRSNGFGLKHRLLLAIITLLASFSFSARAIAQYISSDALFLAPSSIQTRIYDAIDLAPGESRVFSIADVPGASALLEVHILPLLWSNPFQPYRYYSPSDLGAINVSNYAQYFKFLPNVDYMATDIMGGSSTITFGASGPYYVELLTLNGGQSQSSVFRVTADDFFWGGPAPGAKPTGPERDLPLPPADLTVITSADPNNAAAVATGKLIPTAVKASSIETLVAALEKYYNDHGKKKFTLNLFGHGQPGSIEVGGDQVGSAPGSKMSAADFQKLIDKYVSAVNFLSCELGKDEAGKKFLDDIKASIPNATAPMTPITVGAKSLDIGAGDKSFGIATPEPVTWILFVAGFGLVGGAMRRRAVWIELA